MNLYNLRPNKGTYLLISIVTLAVFSFGFLGLSEFSQVFAQTSNPVNPSDPGTTITPNQTPNDTTSSSSSGLTSSSSGTLNNTTSSSSSGFTTSGNTNNSNTTSGALTSSSSGATQVQNVQTQQFKGEVLKNLNNTLTVSDNGNVKEFNIPGNVRVTRNTIDSEISKIEPKDTVTVTFDQNNQVLAVDARAGEVNDAAKIAIPAIIIGLILLGLILYLVNRANKGKIKTTTSTNVG